ncbi:MAG: 4-hydroxybenzoate polyprenyltransferase [Rickettsiales bacterium]|jgi:4-hydroxybenzoate polyprenyltransferase
MRKYLELIRFFQPIGSILLFLSSSFGIIFALRDQNFNLEILQITILFFIGSFVMRSSGCIINDITDRNLDKRVARTKNRPITSGKISVLQALIFLAALLLVGLAILLQFNLLTILLGFVALFLVILYPFCKRFTYYPQFILGITFNFSILMSYSAITNQITFSIILLYFVGLIWTIIYDTIYAFADIEDDLKIGIKSTAIKFSKNPKLILTILGLIKIALLTIIATINSFFIGSFVTIFLYLLFFFWQIKGWDINDKKQCLTIFKNNVLNGVIIGLILF